MKPSITAGAGDTKQCSQCGAAFICGARVDSCWCQNLPPLPASAVDASVDCRCPECLAALISRVSPDGQASRP
ncbi:MAG: hypothetical protein FJ164_09390 [Gammaproteobacteria bacterium]|nr:hypothetical protein [Gammaproteobacteria bacterium]